MSPPSAERRAPSLSMATAQCWAWLKQSSDPLMSGHAGQSGRTRASVRTAHCVLHCILHAASCVFRLSYCILHIRFAASAYFQLARSAFRSMHLTCSMLHPPSARPKSKKHRKKQYRNDEALTVRVSSPVLVLVLSCLPGSNAVALIAIGPVLDRENDTDLHHSLARRRCS